MKKFLKILSYGFAALAIILIGLTIALRVMFPPAKIKAMIEQHAAERLHREVKLGDISLGVVTGLSVSNFQLSESPTFAQGTFISSEKLVVEPRLLPLLAKKLFIKNVTLVKPAVTIVREADGKTYNFSSLAASADAPAKTPAPEDNAVSAWTFLVSKATIESGRLNFIDKSPAAQSTEINDLNVTVRNITLVGPMELQTDFRVKTKGVELALDFAGVVNALKGSAKIKTLTITSAGTKIDITGEAKNLTAEPEFDLAIDLPAVEPALLAALGALPATVQLQGPFSGMATVKGTTADIAIDATLNFTKTGINMPGTFVKPVEVPMEMKAVGNFQAKKDLLLQEFKFSLASFVLSGSGSVLNAVDPKRQLNLKLKTNEFSVPELVKFVPAASLPADVQLNKPAQASCELVGPMDNLAIQNLRFNLSSLQLSGAGVYKSVGETPNYNLRFKTNSFQLEDVAALVPMLQEYALSGKSTVEATVASAPGGPAVKGNAVLQGVGATVKGTKISNIKSTIDFTMKDTSGKLTADEVKHEYMFGKNLDVKWNLKDVLDMAKINGTVTMNLVDGKFDNLQKLTAESKVARLIFSAPAALQKAAKDHKVADKIPVIDKFQRMSGDNTLKNGVMTVNSFDLISDFGTSMKGTIGLTGTQPLDLKARMKIKAGLLRGTIGDIYKNAEGQTEVGMIIKGTVDEPDPTLDFQELQQKAVEKITEKYGEKLGKKAGEFIKGLKW